LAVLTAATGSVSFGQGQVVFANRVTGVFDSPVTVCGSNPLGGPGPEFSAQLFLQGAGGSLTPLLPISTFNPAGIGAAAIADRYWVQQTVDVPGVLPGSQAVFVARVWLTSLGSYDQAFLARGESLPFSVVVGGGLLPPANLTTLQAFSLGCIPEPSTIVLATLGGVALIIFRRKSPP